MLYFIIQSNQNSRGIVVEESDVDDTLEHDFKGHKNVVKTEISEEQYMHRIMGE